MCAVDKMHVGGADDERRVGLGQAPKLTPCLDSQVSSALKMGQKSQKNYKSPISQKVHKNHEESKPDGWAHEGRGDCTHLARSPSPSHGMSCEESFPIVDPPVSTREGQLSPRSPPFGDPLVFKRAGRDMDAKLKKRSKRRISSAEHGMLQQRKSRVKRKIASDPLPPILESSEEEDPHRTMEIGPRGQGISGHINKNEEEENYIKKESEKETQYIAVVQEERPRWDSSDYHSIATVKRPALEKNLYQPAHLVDFQVGDRPFRSAIPDTGAGRSICSASLIEKLDPKSVIQFWPANVAKVALVSAQGAPIIKIGKLRCSSV